MNFPEIKEKVETYLDNKQNQIFLWGIIAVAAFWRLYNINLIPVGMNGNEYNTVQKLISITQNHWQILPADIDRALYYYLMSVVGFVSHFDLTTMRFVQGLIGLGFVYVFYLFIKDWFNRQTALLSALLISTSSFVVLISRNIQSEILVPIAVVSVLYAFTVALRKNKPVYFILAGIITGLTFYVDRVFLFMPAILIGAVAYFYLRNKEIFSSYLRGFILVGISTLIVSLPYFYFIPANFLTYIAQFNPGSIGNFYLNLGNQIQTLFYQSWPNNLYNVGTEPLLDPFITISFLAGFVYAVFYIMRRKFMILINLLLISLFILSLQKIQGLPSLIILFPVIYALSAVMLDYVLTHWVRTFPYNKHARLLMTFVFSLFLFLSVFYNYQKYFWAWGKNQDIQSLYKYKIEYQKK